MNEKKRKDKKRRKTSAEDPNGAAMSIGSRDEGEESKIFTKPLFAVSQVKCLGMGTLFNLFQS